MPMHNFKQARNFVTRAGTTVPDWLAEKFEGLDDDAETRKLVAATVAAGQVQKLAKHGVDTFHFYTMNRADLVFAISHLLGHPPQGRTESRLIDDRTRFSQANALLAAARERILVLDGAMGTMIQALQYDEAEFRGERFADFHRDVRGNNDLLILTQPKAIEDIHADYLRAGADIVATNTFSSTSIAQADYDMSDLAYELNLDGAKLARAAARTRVRPRTASRASSPARWGRPTAPPRSRPMSPIPATAPSPSTICARPMASRSMACSTAAPICCWSRPSSTR